MSRAKRRGKQQFSKRDRGRVRMGLPTKITRQSVHRKRKR